MLGITWKPRIRQRQFLHHQDLSVPGRGTARPGRHARPWTPLRYILAVLLAAAVTGAVAYAAVR